MNSQCTFVDFSTVSYKVAASFDTTDTVLAAWETAQQEFNFNVFRIVASQDETLSVVLMASTDVPFSLSATTKFKTNMDDSSEFAQYDKTLL